MCSCLQNAFVPSSPLFSNQQHEVWCCDEKANTNGSLLYVHACNRCKQDAIAFAFWLHYTAIIQIFYITQWSLQYCIFWIHISLAFQLECLPFMPAISSPKQNAKGIIYIFVHFMCVCLLCIDLTQIKITCNKNE